MTRLSTALALGITLGAFTLGPSAFARGFCHSSDTIQALTPSTLTVKDGSATESIPIQGLSIRAGMYPSNTSVLRVGERVSIFQTSATHPIVVVHPAAHGQLLKNGNAWEVKTHHHGVWGLVNTNPVLLGMRQLTSGEPVAAFGTPTNHEIDVTALAARPLMTRAVVASVGPTSITANSDQYGALTYGLTGLPSHFQQHLSDLSPGKSVILCLNPLGHKVLVLMPDHLDRWAKILGHGTAGELVAVSSKDLTLTNALGTVTVPLNATIDMRWLGHPRATIQQLTPGTHLIVRRSQHQSTLKIHVLPASKMS